MKFEFSAGGIVIRPTKSKQNKGSAVLLVQHSGHHGWGFPKGLIDEGEDKETAALREVKEEGGVEAKIIRELPSSEYFYKFEGEPIKKKVTYFLMAYVSGDIANHDWEMEATDWVPQEKVIDRLTFKSDKEVFQGIK